MFADTLRRRFNLSGCIEPLVTDPRLTYEMKVRAANFYRKADRAVAVRISNLNVGRRNSRTGESGSTKKLDSLYIM
jgi:hypothetical protein